MPSMEESRRQVQERLSSQHPQTEPNHDEILASLQDEIDKHNAVKDDLRHSMREDTRDRDPTSMRFRFKEHVSDPRKRKHRSRREDKHRKSRRTGDDDEQAHPFPREPAKPGDSADPTDAFRESLFDALADDEGAQYWEGVYNQPIHIYPRPTVQTAKGALEEMNDEDYAAYVKTKMWEKKNPHIMLERERSERKRRQAEEARTREREEFVRKKQQTAWQRAQAYSSHGHRTDEYEYVADKTEFVPDPPPSNRLRKQYSAAWSTYLQAWDALKHDLLSAREGSEATSTAPIPAASRIPWPVLGSRAVTKPNIEEFMQYSPSPSPGSTAEPTRTKLRMLKAERVRWHPDKVQQRFQGSVDDETMKTVTGVFQVVDGLLERERTAP